MKEVGHLVQPQSEMLCLSITCPPPNLGECCPQSPRLTAVVLAHFSLARMCVKREALPQNERKKVKSHFE